MGIVNIRTPLPGPRGRRLLNRWHQYEADLAGFQAPVVWQSGKGCAVTDVDGNTFIDWTSGVLVTNVGHCHQHLVERVQAASTQLLNNYECANVYRIEAAERLVRALPNHLDRCFFLSTGSEATEAASRLMKRKTGNYEIICFHGGFHGRTAHAAALGGMPGPKKGYGPALPGMIRVPFPNPYRDPCGWCDGGPDFQEYFDYLEHVVQANSTGSLAGVMVEPYQGAGGFIFPPRTWLPRLEAWIREKGLLFALDEVQSSFGRTGRMWAMDHESLMPDIVAIGKGIGSGIPVSAVAARADVFDCLSKGEMSSTQGGNPVSSAAVIAVLDIIEKEDLCRNAAAIGAYMNDMLTGMMDSCRYLGDVRGQGLVMGLEFVRNRQTKEPAPELIRPIIEQCAANGLLVGSVGFYGNVIRVAPPLVISRAEADESLAIMEQVLMNLKM